jgi:chromosome partitioning protein
METWVVANQKGGVGKTTVSLNIGALLAARGQKVLLIDLDPHASLTAYLKFDPDAVERTAYDVFLSKADMGTSYYKTGIDNLYLLAASLGLATLDRHFGTQQGAGTMLKKALSESGLDMDYVLVDCPPTLGILMVNALAAANFLLIPVQTEFLALKGLERMKHTLDMISQSRRAALPYLIVPTLFDRRTQASRDALEILRENHREDMWGLNIPIDTQFRDASKMGVSIKQFNSHAIGTAACESLLDTVLEMRGGGTPYLKRANGGV